MTALDFPLAPTVGQIYTAAGKSYQWDGVAWNSVSSVTGSLAPMTTLHETVFAGMPVGTITPGANVINGVTWNVAPNTGGSSSIVAAGLQTVAPTGASAENGFESPTALNSIIGQTRWTRGRNALWVRVASCTRGVATSGFFYAPGVYAGGYPDYGLYLRRTLSGSGSQWNGGMWFGSETGQLLNGSSVNPTQDVGLLYFRSPWEVEHWYGTWSGGWPDISTMTQGGMARNPNSFTNNNSNKGGRMSNVVLMLTSGGATGTNTASIVIDRFRITTWD